LKFFKEVWREFFTGQVSASQATTSDVVYKPETIGGSETFDKILGWCKSIADCGAPEGLKLVVGWHSDIMACDTSEVFG
jgi:hypothetical protein